MTTQYFTEGPNVVTQIISITELQYNNLVAGEGLTKWELVFQDGVFIRKSKADDPNRMDAVGLVLDTVASGVTVDVAIRGRLTNTTWTWTSGGRLFASTTAGAITHTPPAASGNVTQRVGIALTPTQIELNPVGGYHLSQ